MNRNSHLNPKVCHIQYVPVSYIINMVVQLNVLSITFAPGKTWLDFYSTPGSVDFEFPTEKKDGNVIFRQKASLFFPGLDIANINNLFNAGYQFYIVKVTMNSGDKYIIGSLQNPAQYIEDFATDKGGRSISFWCDAFDPPFSTTT